MAFPRRTSSYVNTQTGDEMTAPDNPKCKHGRCYVPERECAHGETDYWKDCPYFVSDNEEKVDSKPLEGATDFPWTGNTFGIDDVGWLTARGRPRLVAPVGAHNAGKTTFLVSLYLGLCRGLSVDGYQMAGSFTLGGWENMAAYLRYKPDGIGPTFPPHTPTTAKTAPGLLHIATRDSDFRLHDFLLADSPGEWFHRWAINQADESARGARWVAKHADGFMFFIDCDALTGTNRGVARDDLFKLALRLAGHIGTRPIAIVWAKHDVVVSDAIREQVETRLRQHFPTAKNFTVSAKSPPADTDPARPFLDVLSWIVAQREIITPSPALPPLRPQDPFLAFRGHSV